MPSIFPAEGVTLEFLAKPFQATLLQPIITAGLLLASLRSPQHIQNALSILSRDAVSPTIFRRTLQILLAVGVLYRSNKALSQLVLNNFVSDNSWDWKREIVLVTGGCSGIGEHVVRKLSERNVKVVIFDIVGPRSPLPSNVFFCKVDITSTEEIHEAANKVREEVGHPTVLINNAGIGTNTEILNGTDEQIRLTFHVNVIAHFWMVREFVPHMIQQNHGHIVTTASLASFLVHAGNVDYACTKSAVLAFHEGLGQELKSRYNANKVRTTVVHPTWVRTPLTDTLSQRKGFSEFILEPETVAVAIVSQIYKGQSAQLIIPGRYNMVSTSRGWPSWLQESVRNSVANLLRNVD